MKRILILGATSAIAESFSRLYVQRGSSFFLVARNLIRLESIKQDLLARGAQFIEICALDLNDFDKHPSLIEDAMTRMGGIDIALIAHGTLSDQKKCEVDINAMLGEIKTNFLSPLSLLTVLAQAMEVQGHGDIAVIGSVAGDRGRQSNYIYGSAKGGLALFVQGLRHRLSAKNINVTLIKPGFVDTPMTANIKKGGVLWAQPKQIALDIDKGLRKKLPVQYTPWFWRWIMLIIFYIPDRIFRHMRL